MKIKPGTYCPLIKKDCVGTKCSWFTQIRGTNPNTGQEVDEWGCAVAWLPMLMIENSQQQRQTGAAVESFRNEMTKAQQASQAILLTTAKLIDNPPMLGAQ
jgi:hypothetical protein